MSYGGTCFNCGNENTGFNQTCPACKLIEAQEKQIAQQQSHFEQQQYGDPPPNTWDGILGGIFGIVLFFALPVWWLSDKGFWQSVETVLWAPVAMIVFFLNVFTNLIN